ncbi:CdaR family transcriptional regulator [Lacticaseibacillus parakribbianus]|uniref:CdaR family transcriptional regulator n=1 Tax=Lacticaseibacillus parakribbianus TaxID=2970927 RepID=UPI0021CB37C7|nr:sugar diacid recognition domain-containing protein [Lacticaseibacillus parakribbianus]
MKLEPQLAQAIVHKIMGQLPYNINMMDATGKIIASGDPSRLNTQHVGAVDAIRQRRPLVMAQSHGVNGQPGVNMPILFEGAVIGVIGITGDPAVVEPFAALLSTATQLLIAQERDNRVQKAQEDRLKRFLYQWAQLKDGAFPTSLRLEAKELNIDLTKPRWAVALRGPAASSLPMDAEDYALDLVADVSLVVTALPATLQRCLRFGEDHHLAVGIGQPTTKLGTAIDQALETLEIAALMPPMHYHYFDQIEFLHALLEADLPLAPLLATFQELAATPRGEELIQTLLAYVQNNQNVNQAVAALHIHRNTLNYRLGRLKATTGMDPHQLLDLMRLYIGYLRFADRKAGQR